MTLVTRFEEDEDCTPQQFSKESETNMITTIATTTNSLTRSEMVKSIQLRDPKFVDSASYSDAYIGGRHAGMIAAMPVIGVPKSSDSGQPIVTLDEAELSPVTQAMIAAENDRDRARAAVTLPTKVKRLDAADAGLSAVTKAQMAAHDRDEAQRRGGSDSGSGDAA